MKLQEVSEPPKVIFDQEEIDDIDDVTVGKGELKMTRDVVIDTDETALLVARQGESGKVNVYDKNYFCSADDKVKFTLGYLRMRF